MEKEKGKVTDLDVLIDKHVGEEGTEERKAFDARVEEAIKKEISYPEMYKRPGVRVLAELNEKNIPGVITAAQEKHATVMLEVGYDWGIYYHNLKPILRPLKDITDEEECEYIAIMEASAIAKKSLANEENWKEKQVKFFKIINDFEITWLQEKGFDYLGLIDSGQAIDAKTLEI